jgi:hypothetical protein
MRRVVIILGVVVLGAAPLLFGGDLAVAQIPTCPASGGDFLTGGGFIINAMATDPPGAHANFGVGGSCKQGGGPHGLWGHLEYIDHGTGLNVHWTTITAYLPDFFFPTDLNARVICGTARTNQYGDVNFVVRAADDERTGMVDKFDIQLQNPMTSGIVYTTFASPFFPHKLVGGNVMLHNPNPAGPFGGPCPALGVPD